MALELAFGLAAGLAFAPAVGLALGLVVKRSALAGRAPRRPCDVLERAHSGLTYFDLLRGFLVSVRAFVVRWPFAFTLSLWNRTAVGVSCKDGVVMAVEKVVVSKMLVPGTMRRAHLVDHHSGLVISGLISDGRQLATRARDECSSYKAVYDSAIPGHVLAERLANFAHVYTLYAYVRPFGCAALLGAHDDTNGYQLYLIEPSGVSYRYFGAAVGKGKQAAKTALEKLDFKALTCREAVKELAKIIVDVHDEAKDKLYELEMCWVCEESKNMSQLVPQEVVDEARKAAEAAQDDDSDMDDE